jgi:hypothetical protein
MVLGPFPVSDTWAAAVQEDYEGAAKIVVLREPVPHDISTEYAAVAEGVLGPDLPPWLGQLLAGQLHAATRDVPVSCGQDPLSISIDPSAPTSLPGWAHQIITPAASSVIECSACVAVPAAAEVRSPARFMR